VQTHEAAQEQFVKAFPPSPDWRLEPPAPNYRYTPHFRPYRDTWEAARDAIGRGEREVTVEGIWGDGRVGTATLVATDGTWTVARTWHQGNGEVP
jgi:hypothetical protein